MHFGTDGCTHLVYSVDLRPQPMLRKLRTGKSASGSFTVYQSDEGWLSVHLMTADNRLHIRQARVHDGDHARVMEAIDVGYCEK